MQKTMKKPRIRPSQGDSAQGYGPGPSFLLDPEDKEIRLGKRKLAVALTETESVERARELAKAIQRREKLEDERREQGADLRVRINDAGTQARQLAAVVASGKEDRDVECVEVQSWKTCKARTIRCDSGDVVAERSLRADEVAALRQGQLAMTTAVSPAPRGRGGKAKRRGQNGVAKASEGIAFAGAGTEREPVVEEIDGEPVAPAADEVA